MLSLFLAGGSDYVDDECEDHARFSITFGSQQEIAHASANLCIGHQQVSLWPANAARAQFMCLDFPQSLLHTDYGRTFKLQPAVPVKDVSITPVRLALEARSSPTRFAYLLFTFP